MLKYFKTSGNILILGYGYVAFSGFQVSSLSILPISYNKSNTAKINVIPTTEKFWLE